MHTEYGKPEHVADEYSQEETHEMPQRVYVMFCLTAISNF